MPISSVILLPFFISHKRKFETRSFLICFVFSFRLPETPSSILKPIGILGHVDYVLVCFFSVIKANHDIHFLFLGVSSFLFCTLPRTCAICILYYSIKLLLSLIIICIKSNLVGVFREFIMQFVREHFLRPSIILLICRHFFQCLNLIFCLMTHFLWSLLSCRHIHHLSYSCTF